MEETTQSIETHNSHYLALLTSTSTSETYDIFSKIEAKICLIIGYAGVLEFG